eukprot:9127393-Pyramimonas_sp.AAC.1
MRRTTAPTPAVSQVCGLSRQTAAFHRAGRVPTATISELVVNLLRPRCAGRLRRCRIWWRWQAVEWPRWGLSL